MSHRHPFWRLFFQRLRWETYDPSWLVSIARAQEPDAPWLADSLTMCTRAAWECEAYLYFIDPKRRDTEFSENIVLESTTEGDLVLDILTDRRVAGIEYLDRL